MKSRFKKAIVLGGSKGLGKEIVKSLNSINIKTIACSRKIIDTSNLDSTFKFIKKHKNVDILVLNSGGPPPLKFNEIEVEHWKKFFNQLFLSYFILLKKIKVKKNGYIFYISSTVIKEPGTNIIISSTLRSAMSSLLKSYSLLKNSEGISTINIAPGPFKTGRMKELIKNISKFEQSLPTKKIGKPKEIGEFVKFIVKKKIKYLSGSTIYFDGNSLKTYS